MKTKQHLLFTMLLMLVSFTCIRAQYSASAPMNLSGASNQTITGKEFTSGSNGASIYLNNCTNMKIVNADLKIFPPMSEYS